MNNYSLRVTVAPTVEPVTLEEAKLHLRVDDDNTTEDDLIESLITVAREHAEAFTNRAFLQQTLRMKMDEFPCVIQLPRPQLISVSSIQYVDTAGVTQTLSASLYRVDSDSDPARITPAYGQSWPSTQDITGAVTVTYVAGYGAAATAVPTGIRQAILMLIGTLYENREDIIAGVSAMELPLTSRVLLQPYRFLG